MPHPLIASSSSAARENEYDSSSSNDSTPSLLDFDPTPTPPAAADRDTTSARTVTAPTTADARPPEANLGARTTSRSRTASTDSSPHDDIDIDATTSSYSYPATANSRLRSSVTAATASSRSAAHQPSPSQSTVASAEGVASSLKPLRAPSITGKAEAVIGEARGVGSPEAFITVAASSPPEKKDWLKLFSQSRKKKLPGDEQASIASETSSIVEPPPPSSSATATATSTAAFDYSDARASPMSIHTVPSSDHIIDLRTSAADSDASSVISAQPSATNPSEDAVSTSAKDATPPSIATTGTIRNKVLETHSTSPWSTNEKFHETFVDVPPDDTLIEDYSCALFRDIHVQGRLYLSERHFAFRANILGWTTNVVVPWSAVVSIEKRLTALMIPNAIEISTADTHYTFAFPLYRNVAYEVITAIHEHSRPGSSTNSVSNAEQQNQDPAVDSSKPGPGAPASDLPGKKKTTSTSFWSLFTFARESSPKPNKSGPTEAEKIKQAVLDGERHPPTRYDGDEYKDVAHEFVLATSTELAYELIFEDKEFLRHFLEEDEKVKDLALNDWSDDEPKRRMWSYIKPLNGSVGPKETLCGIEDVVEKADAESYYTAVSTTHTPDVPSGNNFCVKTRTVITWDESGGARIRVTTEVEWTKVNRMLKGIIERNCREGQTSYQKDLEKALNDHIDSNKDKYTIAGAVPVPIASPQPRSPSFGRLLSFLPDPLITLAFLVVFLLFTNVVTLVALRRRSDLTLQSLSLARRHEEVASAVKNVLSRESVDSDQLVSKTTSEIVRELDDVKRMVVRLESQAAELKGRLMALISPLT